jgi:prophage DNA circulation protein
MSDPVIASSPQTFTFGARELKGHLTSFRGQSKRRSVDHEYAKRDGADVEDMGRKQRRLSVRLVFTGPTCAKDYADFQKYVDENPKALLVHPIAGKWQAYTDGPDEDVDYGRALDEIQAQCEFKEAQLDASVTRDVPDPATAAQSADAQKSQFQKTVASFMGGLAKAGDFNAQALGQIDAALSQIDTVTAPVDFLRDAIGSSVNASSSFVGKVSLIATKSNLLAQDVGNYLAAASDLFEGEDPAAGSFSATDTLLGAVEASAQGLEDELIAASVTPAGAAEAVADVVGMRAACWAVASALQEARPPTVAYLVPELMNLMTVAMRTGPALTAQVRAVQIMSLNRIPSPHAIKAGTTLQVPSK